MTKLDSFSQVGRVSDLVRNLGAHSHVLLLLLLTFFGLIWRGILFISYLSSSFFSERETYSRWRSQEDSRAPPKSTAPAETGSQSSASRPTWRVSDWFALCNVFFSKQWRKLFCASWTKCSATCAKKSKPSTCSKCISLKRLTKAIASPPIGGSLCPVSCHQAGVFPCRPSSAHPSGADRFHLTVTDVVLVSPLSPAVAPASNRRRSAANRRARANSLAIRST